MWSAYFYALLLDYLRYIRLKNTFIRVKKIFLRFYIYFQQRRIIKNRLS